MGIPAADILASLSSAPLDKPVRTVRVADVSRPDGRSKGFSAVMKKVRDFEPKDEVRKTDDTPSPSRTDERSQAKDARNIENDARSRGDVRSRGNDGKGRTAAGTETERDASASHSAKPDDRPGVGKAEEGGHTRAEQAEASSTRGVNSDESVSSRGGSVEETATEANGSGTGAEALSNTDTHGQVPLFLSSLVASTTKPQSVDQRSDAEDSVEQGIGDALNTEKESSEATPVIRDASAFPPVVPRNRETTVSGVNRDGALQTQPQSTVVRSTNPAEQGAPIAGTSESRPFSNARESAIAEKIVGPDTSARPSTSEISSQNVKVNALELKGVQPILEPTRMNPVTENPNQDAAPKMNGQFLDHPLLSPSQGPPLATQAHDNGAMKDIPLSQQGPKSAMESTADFREMWAGLRDGKQEQGEGKPLPMAFSEQQSLVGQRTESFAIGAQAGPASGSGSLSQGGTTLSHSQPAQATHTTAPAPFPLATKSLVFDVVQPDLGHVNIRVAMTNDVVHAHLSTDRQEVGQSLISGQERLQSSLQANGLDMGQFRVDIDRQSAGRSFQQGFSQEQQERGWNQQGSWVEGASTSHTYEDTRAPRQGLLNVMA